MAPKRLAATTVNLNVTQRNLNVTQPNDYSFGNAVPRTGKFLLPGAALSLYAVSVAFLLATLTSRTYSDAMQYGHRIGVETHYIHSEHQCHIATTSMDLEGSHAHLSQNWARPPLWDQKGRLCLLPLSASSCRARASAQQAARKSEQREAIAAAGIGGHRGQGRLRDRRPLLDVLHGAL